MDVTFPWIALAAASIPAKFHYCSVMFLLRFFSY